MTESVEQLKRKVAGLMKESEELKRFKKVANGFPSCGDMTMDKWYEILDKMIFSVTVCDGTSMKC
jgi:hypothetical protein